VADDWREQRREAAAAQAERAARARASEAAAARELVVAFVASARERGIPSEPLRARAGDSATTYSTDVVGWYLRRDGSLGAGEDGELYVLSVPRSLRATFTGVRLSPLEPTLQAGVGARDGESIALASLLELRLAAGSDWPLAR
jgi:hypothetical protein